MQRIRRSTCRLGFALVSDHFIESCCFPCHGSTGTQDDLVLYGDMGAVSPLDVLNWHVSAAYSSTESLRMPEGEDLYFVSPGVTVVCEGEEPPARPKQGTAHAQAHAYAQAYGQPYTQVYAQAYAQAYGQEGQVFGQAYGQAPGGADQEATVYGQRAHGEEAVGVDGADAAAAYAAAAAAQVQAQGQGQGAFYAYVGADGNVHYAGQYAVGPAAVQGHHTEAAAHDAFPVGDALPGHDATAARDLSADHDTLADDDASDAYEAYIDAGYAILEHYRAHSPQLSKHGARYEGHRGKGRSYSAAGEAEDDSLYYADHYHSGGQEKYKEEYEEEGSKRSSRGGR